MIEGWHLVVGFLLFCTLWAVVVIVVGKVATKALRRAQARRRRNVRRLQGGR